MPKLPTFEAEGTISQQTGTTTNVQIPLTQTLGTALKPVTDFVVKQKIQEKNFENRTEALKLENDFVVQMAKIYDKANILDNKDQAQSIVKEEGNALIDQFSSKASNANVKTLFTNNALSEIQKGIFRTNNQVSKNMLNSLQNAVDQKEQTLISNAFLGGNDLDYATLPTDLEKLYRDNYTGRISNANLDALINNIPVTIELHEARDGMVNNPRQNLLNLKNPEKFKNVSFETRTKLIEENQRILRQPVLDEFKNYILAASKGKEIEFDVNFAKEVLDPITYNTFLQKYNIATETVRDAAIINSIPLENLSSILEELIQDKYQKYDEQDADELENTLKKIAQTRREEMEKDPVKFLIQTNDEIEQLREEILTEKNDELRIQKELELTNLLYQTQVDMGSPSYDIKVTSDKEAENFVNRYMSLNPEERIAVLQNAENRFGDFFSKAMNEYSAKGLPITAELSAFFVNPNLTRKFLSFDSEDERNRLDRVLINNDTSITKVREQISDGLQKFKSRVVFGNRFDTSAAANKMDRIEKVLAYYAANEIFITGEVSNSVENAVKLITDNFDLTEDSFFVPKIYNGDTLLPEQIDFVIEKSKKVINYLDDWGIKSFGSTKIDDQNALDQEMKEQIKENGRWVNNTDGTGIIFGIIMSDGSFAPVLNSNNQTLEIMFDDSSYLVPNTDIKFNQIKKRKKKRGQT